MLAGQHTDEGQPESDKKTKEEDAIPPKVAWVARNRSGASGFNTLTPRWEFKFSV
jgi:hypothetical protein